MLVIRRKEGQWIRLTHSESGQVIRLKIASVTHDHRSNSGPQIAIAFDDQPRNFEIHRENGTPGT